MNKKRKYLLMSVGIFGILLGRVLNRVLSIYFGNDSSNIVISVSGVIIICTILISIIMGYFRGALQLFLITIPMIIAGIGVYLNNMDVAEIGIIIALIFYPIFAIIMKRLKPNK